MKWDLNLLLVFMLFGSANGYSQNDTLISNVAAVWNFKTVVLSPNGNSNVWTSYDSLINDSVMIDNRYWSSYYSNSIQTPAAYILVDSGKVYAKLNEYYFVQDTSSVFLLYDFDLEVGDTAYYDSMYFDHGIVQNIGDTAISGQSLKTYQLSNTDFWIEKIGSVNGLLRPVYFQMYSGGTRQLCEYTGDYIDSTGLSYQLSLIDESTCILNVEENQIELYYIRANNHSFTIDSDLSLTAGSEAYLYDINGRMVLSTRITESSQTVNWSFVKAGMYVLRLGNQSEKMIKY